VSSEICVHSRRGLSQSTQATAARILPEMGLTPASIVHFVVRGLALLLVFTTASRLRSMSDGWCESSGLPFGSRASVASSLR
jgi:hypothetical protein